MEQTKDKIYASSAQWQVIQWLFHYPGIYLCWDDMYDTSTHFSVRWESEGAWQHMVKVMGDIGYLFGIHDVETRTKPRIRPLEGGTPRCRFQTFKALLKEGVLCKYTNGLYQLNPKIRKQLEVDELELLTPSGKEEWCKIERKF